MRQDHLYRNFGDWLHEQGEDEIEDLDDMRNRLDNMFGNAHEKYEWVMNTIDDIIKKRRFDIVVSKERKGSYLFSRYLKQKPTQDITHFKFDLLRPENVKGKAILVFDDGIHYTNTMRNIIHKLKEFGAASILIEVLISDEEGFKKLEKEFPDILFNSALKVHPEDYTRTYNLTFYRIFDMQDEPLDTHLELDIFIKGVGKLADLTSVFIGLGNGLYGIPRLEPANQDVIKGTVMFDPLQLKPPEIGLEYNIEMYKVRFYIYDEGGMRGIKIKFTPIVHIGNVSLDQCSRTYDGCGKILDWVNKTKSEDKAPIACLECCEIQVTEKLFSEFEATVRKRLKDNKIETADNQKRWDKKKKYRL